MATGRIERGSRLTGWRAPRRRSGRWWLTKPIRSQSRGVQILFGMAGGANGGDILFHEICEALGIKTLMYLALPKEQYVGDYVAKAGPEWVERFDALYRRHKVGGLEMAPDPYRPR